MEGASIVTRPNPDPTTLTTEQLHHEISWVKDLFDKHLISEESRLKERKELFLQLLGAGDKLINERIDGVLREMAITDKANVTAIAKSESGYDKRFEAVNEFRQLVNDRDVKFMGATESRALHKAHEDKMNALTQRFNIMEGRDGGKDSSKSEIRSNVVAAVGVVVGLASLFLFLSGLSSKVDRNTYGRIEQAEKAK